MTAKKTAAPVTGEVARARLMTAAESVQIRCLIADDVRAEHNGKTIGIGMYLDNVILMEVSAGQADPTPKAPIAMHQFAVVLTFTGPEGDYEISFKLGDDKPMERSIHLIPGNSVNLIWHFRPVLVASFGIKRITVLVDKVEHVFAFEVRRRIPYAAPQLKPAPRRTRRPKQ